MKVNYKQLTFAREYRGLTQTNLSKAVQGLSQSNLSKFEKGLGGLSDDILPKIFKVLDFPEEFFTLRITASLETANYRKKSSISKSLIREFESYCIMLGYIIDQLSESIEFPDFSLVMMNVEDGYTPAGIANFTRKNFRIPADVPIEDIFKIIENKGIIIYEIDIDEKFDGISLFTEKGFPVIVLNKNFSNDRKRFTLAHELGHLVMHCSPDFPVHPERDKEQEANEFAAEFLMPKKSIENSLYGFKYSDLSSLKNYWLTSKASIVRRAYDLKVISRDRYQFFNIELSRNGERKREKEDVKIDYPSVLKESIKLHFKDLEYTEEELGRAFCLPNDIIHKFCSNEKYKRPKLKIMRI